MDCTNKFTFCLRLTTCNAKKGLMWIHNVQKMKFSIKDFFSKRDQICRKLRIWSHLPKRKLHFLCSAMSNLRVKVYSRVQEEFAYEVLRQIVKL